MKKIVHILLWKLLSITYKCWPDTFWLKIIYQSRMHRKPKFETSTVVFREVSMAQIA